MPTRFYLPDTGTPAITPTVTTGWDQITGATSFPTDVAKTDTAHAAGAPRAKDATTANTNRLDRKYISTRQLSAQTISAGTFSAVIRGLESNTAADAWLQIIIRVVSADGTTERGQIYGGSTATTESATAGAENQEFGTASQTRIKDSIPTSSVVAQAGDRIQIDIGARFNGTTSTHTVTYRWGDATAAGDFALAAGLTTDASPWVELSQDLTWQSVTVTPDPAVSSSEARDPAVSSSVIAAPGVAAAAPSGHDPTVTTSVAVTPGTAAATVSALDPAVTTTVTATPDVASSVAGAVPPTVTATVTVAPGLAGEMAAAHPPTVTIEGGPITAVPDLATATPEAFAPTVGGGVTVLPGDAAVIATAHGPVLVPTVTLSPGLAGTPPVAHPPSSTGGAALRDITLSISPGRSRSVTAAGRPRATSATGASRTLTATPRE